MSLIKNSMKAIAKKSIKPGQKFCPTCRKKFLEMHRQLQSASSQSENEPDKSQLSESVNSSFLAVGVSPLKFQRVSKRDKAYTQSFRGTGSIDNSDGRVIRFQLKGIFKPKHGEPDVRKAGQGISAWSVDACAMFCSIFRILTRLVVKTECPHVLTDAYMAEQDFIVLTTNKLKELPQIAKFATTDGIQFDANQNAFTQLLERMYWQAYGVPEEFLDHYYSFRTNYKVISSVAIGLAGTQKTSGEPGTLVNNGVISKLISNYVIDGEGPQVTVYKGDDYTRRQLNLTHNLAKQSEVNSACTLGLRVTVANSTEFCGLMFADGALYPSIPRKINKICAHRFRTINAEVVIGSNAAHYATTFDETQAAYDFILSMSHIDRTQFFEMFKMKTETAVIPVLSPTGIAFIEQVGPTVKRDQPGNSRKATRSKSARGKEFFSPTTSATTSSEPSPDKATSSSTPGQHLLEFVNAARRINFSLNEQRQQTLERLNKPIHEAPFGSSVRFPEQGLFVDLDFRRLGPENATSAQCT
ncbi:hypothetical protein FQR65_LT19738 [Abscondita terminalis]|nr:hypothetical protein FQR65_LT19738 [Abscondita terminalis]